MVLNYIIELCHDHSLSWKYIFFLQISTTISQKYIPSTVYYIKFIQRIFMGWRVGSQQFGVILLEILSGPHAGRGT